MTRFSRRTSLLSAILILSMGAATAQDVPKHLQLAREFLANTHPEDNLYVDKGNMYVKATLNKPSKFPARTRKTPFFGFCGLLRRPFGPFAGP